MDNTQIFSRLKFLPGLLLFATVSHAEDGLSEQIVENIASVVSVTWPRDTNPTLVPFTHPVSFSFISDETSKPVMTVLSSLMKAQILSDECWKTVLNDAPDETPVDDILDQELDSIVELVKSLVPDELSSANVSDGELSAFVDYWVRHRKTVLQLQSKDDGASSKNEELAARLLEIETDWEAIGFRYQLDFISSALDEHRDLGSKASPQDIRSLVFSDVDGEVLDFSLSIPPNAWVDFDSWSHVRQTSFKSTSQTFFRINDPISYVNNPPQCDDGCLEIESSSVELERLGFQFIRNPVDLPWLNELARFFDSNDECRIQSVPLEIVLLRSLSTAPDKETRSTVLQSAINNEVVKIDGFQFSGNPDIGANYFSSPRFAHQGVESPFYHIFGLLNQDRPDDG